MSFETYTDTTCNLCYDVDKRPGVYTDLSGLPVGWSDLHLDTNEGPSTTHQAYHLCVRCTDSLRAHMRAVEMESVNMGKKDKKAKGRKK